MSRVIGRYSNVKSQNMRVCTFLIVLKNEVFLLVIVG